LAFDNRPLPRATIRVRLLFISNLFPDTREPYRGLDNATLLHALAPRWEIRAVALRPMLPWKRAAWQPRAADVALRPDFVRVPYVPKFGGRWNHRLYARALRRRLATLRRDWAWDAVLCAWLFPDACAVDHLREEFGFHFTAIAQGSDVHQYLKMPARRAVMLEHLKGAKSIVTRSAELARLLGEAGLRKDRLHPIYNGVDVEAFHPITAMERVETRATYGISVDDPVVLFVGNFLPIKNPLLLLDAFTRLRAIPDLRDARLILAGAGPMEAELRRRALPLGSAVIFAGRQDAAGVARLMRAADTLALTSDNEGVPNVILEAFATGLPVVSTRVGGIPEVHQGEVHGALVPPGDAPAFAEALHVVLAAHPDRARIAKHGRTFTWEAAADSYEKVLKAGLGQS
jgi:glycosyltransferase involved in cell wall biosynthesis